MPVDLRGVLHVHSTYSDGTGSVEEIVEAAKRADLDFVVLNDHDTLAGYEREGLYNSLLFLAGTELGFKTSHYLVLGLSSIPEGEGLARFRKVAETDGTFGWIAHPFDENKPFFKLPGYRWQIRDFAGFQGIEIWNYLSDFGASVNSLPKAVLAPLFPDLFVSGPDEQTVRFWDKLTETGSVVGVGGGDVHALKIRVVFFTITVFPYEKMFRAITVHVLLDDLPQGFAARKEAVLRALQAGHSYTAYEWYGPVTGFSFTGSTQGGKMVGMGERISYDRCTELHARSPRAGEMRLLCGGRIVAETVGKELRYVPQHPGAYRVEVYVHKFWRRRPLIFSNPIYLT